MLFAIYAIKNEYVGNILRRLPNPFPNPIRLARTTVLLHRTSPVDHRLIPLFYPHL
jgi:hypothetical protein